jgi:cytidylate kinase
MAPVVVAVDGPAGSGKSTLARRLAAELDLPYLNTGLMYRAVALRALDHGVDPSDGAALAALVGDLSFSLDATGNPPALLIDGSPPSQDLVGERVESSVSGVSRHPEVRELMRREQRRLGADGGVVEGRDIGTVVFPDAAVKIFLNAAAEERAARRVEERRAEAREDAGSIASALHERDESDAETNPPEPAPGAVVIETTDADPDEVFRRALTAVGDSAGR